MGVVEGDLVVATAVGPVRVDPVSGETALAYVGAPLFNDPRALAWSHGRLMSFDFPWSPASGPPAPMGVYTIDPMSGAHSLLTEDSPLTAISYYSPPGGMTIATAPNGDLWIPDRGGETVYNAVDGSFFAVPASRIVRFDPRSGVSTPIAVATVLSEETPAGLLRPTAVALSADEILYVVDGKRLSQTYANSRIVAVDLRSSNSEIVCPDPAQPYHNRRLVVGIALDAWGRLLFSEVELSEVHGAYQRIVRLDPQSCVEEIVADGGFLLAPSAIAFEPDGHLIVADRAHSEPGSVPSDPNPPPLPAGRVIRIDPAAYDPMAPAANQQLLAENLLLTDPRSLVVVPEPPGPLRWLAALASLAWLRRDRRH